LHILEDNYDTIIDNIDKKIETEERRLKSFESDLRMRFRTGSRHCSSSTRGPDLPKQRHHPAAGKQQLVTPRGGLIHA
jgi:hypothetical protein